MTPRLPDLLEALGDVFLVPGAVGAGWSGFKGAPWASPELREGLEVLVAAPKEDLGVAYAGLFLAGFRQRTLHLEVSVLRTGLLKDEAVIRDLEALYDAAGIHPKAGVPPDHLGTLLMLLGHLLRQGQAEAAGALLHGHLEPLAASLEAGLEGASPFYAGAGRTLKAALALCSRLLG